MGHTDESADGTLTRRIENKLESKGEEIKRILAIKGVTYNINRALPVYNEVFNSYNRIKLITECNKTIWWVNR